ncbi:MAG: alpha-amylase family protein [Succinivibrionaceae bacterium]|nr:alpha-amylase family protein [Succinivibrionaceae bacterium]
MNMWNLKKTLLASAMMSILALTNGCGGGGSSSGGSDTPDTPTVTTKDVDVSSVTPLPNNLTCNRGEDLSAEQKKVCDLRIYHVMVSTFQNGDDFINYKKVGYGPGPFNGDIAGITKAVPFIKSLNMNAVLTTPFMKSCELSGNCTQLDSTGYFVSDYGSVDPHFGTDNDVITLAYTLHNEGMYFFGDIAMGHMKTDNLKTNVDGVAGTLTTTNTCLNLGGTYTNNDSKQICAKFPESLSFFTNYMYTYTQKWNLDGWRFDQGYQVPVDNQRGILNSLTDAATQDSTLGLAFAEIWSGNKDIKDYAITGKKDSGIESAFAFQTRYAIVKTFATQEWAKDIDGQKKSASTLLDMFKDEQNVFKPEEEGVNIYPISFITNHDLVRFADLVRRAEYHKQISANQSKARTKAALSYLASLSGPISNFYGEEIGQSFTKYPDQPELNDRRDNHCFKEGGNYICDDNVSRIEGKIKDFNADEQEVLDYFTKLMSLRAQMPALSMGRTDLLAQTADDYLVVRKQYSENNAVKSTVLYGVNVSENKRVTLNIEPKDIIKDWSDSDTLNDPITGTIYERSYRKKESLDENGEVVLDANGNPKMEDDLSSPFVFRVELKPLSSVYLVKTGTVRNNKI